MKMNIPVIFQFLKDLSANNNREWFNEHRSEYEVARAEFDNFLATVIARISLFDETIRGIQPKDCTYRIYRDTRFSADKTPYKIHFGGYIMPKARSPIIADTMCICSLTEVCLPEEACVCLQCTESCPPSHL